MLTISPKEKIKEGKERDGKYWGCIILNGAQGKITMRKLHQIKDVKELRGQDLWIFKGRAFPAEGIANANALRWSTKHVPGTGKRPMCPERSGRGNKLIFTYLFKTWQYCLYLICPSKYPCEITGPREVKRLVQG